MRVLALLAPFVLLGVGVLFVAFSGGPRGARRTYLTRGGRGAGVFFALMFAGFGIVLPGVVIAANETALGGTGPLASEEASGELAEGKMLFGRNCASCHSLAAYNARGATGPNLDQIGLVDRERILNAIRIGGTGDGRMPPALLAGEEARAVADYLATVAGRTGRP